MMCNNNFSSVTYTNHNTNHIYIFDIMWSFHHCQSDFYINGVVVYLFDWVHMSTLASGFAFIKVLVALARVSVLPVPKGPYTSSGGLWAGTSDMMYSMILLCS